ncbi:MAG: hypothetical protein U1E73_01970 [Planctomycetota bacterium]
MKCPSRLPHTLAALAFAGSVCAQYGGAAKSFEDGLARYKETSARLPFVHHTDGRLKLATTHDARALRILADDYTGAKDYPEFTKYTIARMLEQHFNRAEFVPVLAALRQANDKPVDAWMWMQTLVIQTDRVSDAEAVKIATTDKNVLHRAVAILALGESRSGRIKEAIVQNCVEFPKRDSDRAMLLGAMSGTLWELRRQVNDENYREAITAYIGLLAPEVGLDHTMKVQMARHLQWILKGPALFVNPDPWLAILSHGDVKQAPQHETRAASRFFSVETEGERFVYVVDMSNSMCRPIEPGAKPASAITGPRPKKKKGALLDESDIPWNLITTRWDLAREEIRISLSRLGDDKYFAVVWFGDDAGTLDATKGLVKATRANIVRAMDELDAIKPGPKDPVRAPDGQLRGQTNMHAGLRWAFSLSRKGFVEHAAYVDPDVLTEGCDTIFLLSDGAPSWDEFSKVDKNYGEGRAIIEAEYKVEVAPPKEILYHGPYDEGIWLVEDLRRMNSLRRIRMHCVGLGEANMSLLEELARMGHGEAIAVGKK